MLDLDEIESRANAATPGPWKMHKLVAQDSDPLPLTPDNLQYGEGIITETAIVLMASAGEITGFLDIREEDEELIIHSRTDIPALCRELRAARKALEQIRDDEDEDLSCVALQAQRIAREALRDREPSPSTDDQQSGVLEDK